MNDASSDYELLDFGAGRKLERFGPVVLDRPSPAALGVDRARPRIWAEATARYERTQGDQGVWTPKNSLHQQWRVSFPIRNDGSKVALTFQLHASPFGHVGVFPEQRPIWDWLARQVFAQGAKRDRPLRVLNLFAYTGGSTLAAAAAGAEVVHIDSARNIVERARLNAELSGLGDRPIRWIAEDAQRFCQRELKRGNRYEAVVLDPPSYGHGPKGEHWKIGEHLLQLLKMCRELTADRRAFVLVTCHTPGFGQAEVGAYVAEGVVRNCGQPPTTGELFLETSDGRRLPSGVFARWPA